MEGPHGAAGVGGDPSELNRPPFGQPLFVGVFLVEGPAPAEVERLRRDAWAVVELCDWIGRADRLPRYGGFAVGALRAGSKVMWAEEWGGYPPEEFFAGLDPVLLPILRRLPVKDVRLRHSCRYAQPRMGGETGAVGAGGHRSGECRLPFGRRRRGICHGTVVLNLGTSACYMAVMPPEKMGDRMVEGIFGQVDGSILPGMVGFEAGMSAFGDVTRGSSACSAGRCAKCCCRPILRTRRSAHWPRRPEERLLAKLAEAAAQLPLRADAPLATDYLNGRRSPYPCNRLTGSVVGLNLSATAPELYYAFAEATVFATKAILDHLAENGVEIGRLVGIGGISRNPLCHAAARRCDGHGDRSLRQRALLRARRRGP